MASENTTSDETIGWEVSATFTSMDAFHSSTFLVALVNKEHDFLGYTIFVKDFGLLFSNFARNLREPLTISKEPILRHSFQEADKFKAMVKTMEKVHPLMFFKNTAGGNEKMLHLNHINVFLLDLLISDIKDERVRALAASMVEEDIQQKIIAAISRSKSAFFRYQMKNLIREMSSYGDFLTEDKSLPLALREERMTCLLDVTGELVRVHNKVAYEFDKK